MNTTQTDASSPRKPLRLWPGVILVILQWLTWFVVPFFLPDFNLYGMLGGVVCALGILVWWMFSSRAPWVERVGAFVLMIVAPILTKFIVHKSIAGGGMGMLLFILVVPVLCLALVVWAVASRRLSAGPRRAALVAVVLLACGMFTLIRTGGITADFHSDFHWRWTKTPEEKLLAQADVEPSSAPALTVASPASQSGADWPGFRGSKRDSIVRGVQIKTDWAASPPVEIWRRPIGPGWSSFAVRGDLFYTQEQRGDNEVVACYKASTGQPVWTHKDAARFFESNAGAGPRATPTLSNNRVYTFGATGILNALDANNGSVLWTRNVASETNTKVPFWGFASSPLVLGDLVIIAASGQLVAYDAATGNRRWLGPNPGGSYSSPHLATIDGVEQVLLVTGAGTTSVSPADGKQLWSDSWAGNSIVQPALTPDGDVLISSQENGTRRIAIAHNGSGWSVVERWTSNGLKPYFNDFVVHKGYAYGFDGRILACIDLKDGERK